MYLPLACATFATNVFLAGAFFVHEQGAEATGQAGAFIASARSPAAVFYNPSAISQLEGIQVSLGGVVLAPSVSFEAADGSADVSAKRQYVVLPNGYLTYSAAPGCVLGIGVSTPFGLSIEWPKDWAGSSILVEQRLNTVFVSSVIALDASNYLAGLSSAVSIELVPASFYLRRSILAGEAAGWLELGGRALGAGARVGLTWRPVFTSGLAFGLVWRSPVVLRFKGQSDADVPPQSDLPRSALPPDGAMTTTLRLPQSFELGVAYAVADGLIVEADLGWTGWSSLKTLRLRQVDGSVSRIELRWRSALAARVGATLALGGVMLRGGFAFDQSPVPSARLEPGMPDANRCLLATGVGVRLPLDVRLNAALGYVLPTRRRTTAYVNGSGFEGSYALSAWVATLSLDVVFDGRPGEDAQ